MTTLREVLDLSSTAERITVNYSTPAGIADVAPNCELNENITFVSTMTDDDDFQPKVLLPERTITRSEFIQICHWYMGYQRTVLSAVIPRTKLSSTIRTLLLDKMRLLGSNVSRLIAFIVLFGPPNVIPILLRLICADDYGFRLEYLAISCITRFHIRHRIWDWLRDGGDLFMPRETLIWLQTVQIRCGTIEMWRMPFELPRVWYTLPEYPSSDIVEVQHVSTLDRTVDASTNPAHGMLDRTVDVVLTSAPDDPTLGALMDHVARIILPYLGSTDHPTGLVSGSITTRDSSPVAEVTRDVHPIPLTPGVQAIIDAIPDESDEYEKCIICSESLDAAEKEKELPCGHKFHSECICGWFCAHRPWSCPLCRAEIFLTTQKC